ncbi:hypothetical protein MMC18_007806 [Xylographa bjoerkii]|nr:hypothetical protein [Xylographa bjoerkii]
MSMTDKVILRGYEDTKGSFKSFWGKTNNGEVTDETKTRCRDTVSAFSDRGRQKKAGIPAGYSTNNWDPDEVPIVLLGSIFDANLLGKWIYDWTVHHHGPRSPTADVAGDLWLLLIRLAGKIKWADRRFSLVRAIGDIEMIQDFLESGDRIWDRLKKLLKVCEDHMWKAYSKDIIKSSKRTDGNNHSTEHQEEQDEREDNTSTPNKSNYKGDEISEAEASTDLPTGIQKTANSESRCVEAEVKSKILEPTASNRPTQLRVVDDGSEDKTGGKRKAKDPKRAERV